MPGKVILRTGEEYRFLLPGMGSVGYEWINELKGSHGIIDVSFESALSVESDPARGLKGCSAEQFLIIRGARPGNITLHIMLSRTREQLKPPRMEHWIDVTVLE